MPDFNQTNFFSDVYLLIVVCKISVHVYWFIVGVKHCLV